LLGRGLCRQGRQLPPLRWTDARAEPGADSTRGAGQFVAVAATAWRCHDDMLGRALPPAWQGVACQLRHHAGPARTAFRSLPTFCAAWTCTASMPGPQHSLQALPGGRGVSPPPSDLGCQGMGLFLLAPHQAPLLIQTHLLSKRRSCCGRQGLKGRTPARCLRLGFEGCCASTMPTCYFFSTFTPRQDCQTTTIPALARFPTKTTCGGRDGPAPRAALPRLEHRNRAGRTTRATRAPHAHLPTLHLPSRT